MFGKIYLALLAVATAVMAFFTYYSCSWLKSVGAPAIAIAGYDYHSGHGWTALWITTVLLLILGNAVLWATGRAWAMWLTVAYFGLFSVLRSFWLEPSAVEFRTANSLPADAAGIGPVFAAVLIVFVTLIAFLDQFMIVRLRMATYAPLERSEAETDGLDTNEKPTESP
jgi:hypothetical protein